jgi:hypothetical protein
MILYTIQYVHYIIQKLYLQYVLCSTVSVNSSSAPPPSLCSFSYNPGVGGSPPHFDVFHHGGFGRFHKILSLFANDLILILCKNTELIQYLREIISRGLKSVDNRHFVA